MTRDDAIKRMKTALRKRTGRAWSVTGGRGSAWGWIKIDAPPVRRTWDFKDAEWVDTGIPGRAMGPQDRADLARALSLNDVSQARCGKL